MGSARRSRPRPRWPDDHGTGAVLVNGLIAKMVTDWFAGREIVTALSISIASWPFGLAIGLVAYDPLAKSVGLARDHASRSAGARGLRSGRADHLSRSAGYAARCSGRAFASNLTRREWLLVLLAAPIWGLFNVAYIVLISFAPEPVHRTGLFACRGKRHRQPHRLGADPVRSALGAPGGTFRPTEPFMSRIRDRVRRPSSGPSQPCRLSHSGSSARDRRAGRD